MQTARAALVGLILLGLAFILVDCSCGRTRFLECIVIDHEFIPGWLEVGTITDSEGRTSTYTVYHPEEYHVLCRESGANLVLDCSASKAAYFAHTNDQAVTVKTRMGRWTGGHYLPRLAD